MRRLLAAIAALALFVPPAQADVRFRPFDPDSWLNTKIPSTVSLAPYQTAKRNNLKSDVVADLYEYGVPIFDTNEAVPKVPIRCRYEPEWGDCVLNNAPRPIPASSRPSPGSDAAMSVVNHDTGQTYDFWQARKDADGGWTTSFGCVNSLSGDAREAPAGPPCSSTGGNISRLAGVVRTDEIRDGVIPHALFFSSSYTSKNFQYPAQKSDSSRTGTGMITYGARVRLKPATNCAAIGPRGPRIVCVALKQYGAYALDSGGASMAFIFENPIGESDPYPSNGLPWDYYHMPEIPWGNLQVLAHCHCDTTP